jgi:hypothetical protein
MMSLLDDAAVQCSSSSAHARSSLTATEIDPYSVAGLHTMADTRQHHASSIADVLAFTAAAVLQALVCRVQVRITHESDVC